MDWEAIENQLVQAVRQAFDDFVAENGTDGLYALCLSISEDGMGLGLNATTESCFNEKLSSESAIEEITPQYKSYLRWSPAEWCFEGVGDDIFQPINDTLTQVVLNDELNDSDFLQLINLMIASLRKLRESQAKLLHDITLFVTITDSDESKKIENRSAVEINPPEVAQGFVSRIG
ncbi:MULTISPECIES: DUF4303 domain-containing protein [unclassified Sphingomonas]|uniref:DUF4303 domain-containing protein n=1 Tax=unclassified Sphingomonas TaxID=196159 RepID=UPI0009EB37E0|nr:MULTISPECIES: DUF4303 domain-containing protein [unclassified Sphingomonas]